MYVYICMYRSPCTRPISLRKPCVGRICHFQTPCHVGPASSKIKTSSLPPSVRPKYRLWISDFLCKIRGDSSIEHCAVTSIDVFFLPPPSLFLNVDQKSTDIVCLRNCSMVQWSNNFDSIPWFNTRVKWPNNF